jgi:hypothetical protein
VNPQGRALDNVGGFRAEEVVGVLHSLAAIQVQREKGLD